MAFYLYILYNLTHDKFYIGQTYSLEKRITEHKTGKGNYTRRYSGNWFFIYYEKLPSRADAMRREKYFKSLKNKEFLKEYIRNWRKSASSSVG